MWGNAASARIKKSPDGESGLLVTLSVFIEERIPHDGDAEDEDYHEGASSGLSEAIHFRRLFLW